MEVAADNNMKPQDLTIASSCPAEILGYSVATPTTYCQYRCPVPDTFLTFPGKGHFNLFCHFIAEIALFSTHTCRGG